MEKLGVSFFERDPLTCARELVGSILIWKGCAGKIVETEAYNAIDDPACHTWTRPSSRHFVENHSAGAAYIYLNYGVHWLFNLLVKGCDQSGFVLVRALEPISGIELMRARRGLMADERLMSGPGKLTRALGIDGSSHGHPFLDFQDCGITCGKTSDLVAGPRIGISRAAERHWRFGDSQSKSLSKKFP